MNDFLTDLYNYISEHTPSLKDDFEYQRALQAYMELEAKVKEKIGDDLLYQYQCAEADLSHRQDVAIFVQTLRFSHSFMRNVLNV